ncbi:DUF975 family protein [Marinicrinis sediminis]|uniref:DUF975 family protein n=1 Tax=Marinicrinis sediminis TaxID=1652465 RepID=A0ABW5R6D1_9BACL
MDDREEHNRDHHEKNHFRQNGDKRGIPNSENYREMAQHRLKGMWTKAVLAGLVYGLLVSIPNYIPNIDDPISIVLSIFLTGPLFYGLSLFFLSFARGKDTAYSQLFKGFEQPLKSFLLYVMQTVLTLLWTMLLIVPGIIAWLKYSMAYYLMIDHPELKPMEAIRESTRLMEGNKMRYFKLNLSFLGWYILCVLSCGIGFLWVLPYLYTTQALFYESIQKEKETGSGWLLSERDENMGPIGGEPGNPSV